MRRIILVAILLALVTGCAGEAAAQTDCRAVFQHLNETLKAPAAFDVESFVGKYRLEYVSCAAPQGAVYCFKCLHEAGAKSLQIVISGNGRLVSPPTYGCRCGSDVKWKQAP
jgi:hypothetical protein